MGAAVGGKVGETRCSFFVSISVGTDNHLLRSHGQHRKPAADNLGMLRERREVRLEFGRRSTS